MRLLKIIVIIHLLGLLVFNLLGLLNTWWATVYFIWDKSVGAGFMVWLALYFSLPVTNKWIIRPVLIVALLRFSWQIVAYVKGWNINNEWWLALFFIY